jgi:hypothetical protein
MQLQDELRRIQVTRPQAVASVGSFNPVCDLTSEQNAEPQSRKRKTKKKITATDNQPNQDEMKNRSRFEDLQSEFSDA